MNLSKKSREVAETTGIGVDLSRLVGEYAGNDLYLLPGQCFYDIEMEGYSFVKTTPDLGWNSGIIGKNIHVNEWIVKKRTPKSYVIRYNQTAVVCETDFGLTYKYRAILPKKNVRRVFPFRRKIQTAQILKELAERNCAFLVCSSTVHRNGDFYLKFSEINGE